MRMHANGPRTVSCSHCYTGVFRHTDCSHNRMLIVHIALQVGVKMKKDYRALIDAALGKVPVNA